MKRMPNALVAHDVILTMRYLFLFCVAFLGFQQRSLAQCASGETFTVNPAPVAGAYAAGQTVDVCYTVGGFQQTKTNWMHGFVLQLGNGWDPTSLVITQMPTAVSTNGSWDLYTSVTSTATGQTFGLACFSMILLRSIPIRVITTATIAPAFPVRVLGRFVSK